MRIYVLTEAHASPLPLQEHARMSLSQDIHARMLLKRQWGRL
jgi:hypothetical protein